jgi:hypothetical protein
MKIKKSVDTEDLISCFFGECETLYRFLSQKHDLDYIGGLSLYKNHRQIISSFKPGKPFARPFTATARFEKHGDAGTNALEINFFEETCALSCHVILGHVERINIDDLLKASKNTHAIKTDGKPVYDTEAIEQEMAHLSDIIISHANIVLNPDPRIVERAIVIKETLLEHNLRRTLKENMHEATLSAAHAFMKKNYVRVIELLSPYKTFLSAADLKKLRVARERIAQSM